MRPNLPLWGAKIPALMGCKYPLQGENLPRAGGNYPSSGPNTPPTLSIWGVWGVSQSSFPAPASPPPPPTPPPCARGTCTHTCDTRRRPGLRRRGGGGVGWVMGFFWGGGWGWGAAPDAVFCENLAGGGALRPPLPLLYILYINNKLVEKKAGAADLSAGCGGCCYAFALAPADGVHSETY